MRSLPGNDVSQIDFIFSRKENAMSNDAGAGERGRGGCAGKRPANPVLPWQLNDREDRALFDKSLSSSSFSPYHYPGSLQG